ncbi:Hypothetical predicted protein [Paramuricea clavata]|uniref:Uncharacterized protein n=1 Tax=Paramuricea clavata TaxID=317549 RepID=A0A6S7K6V1_PARCT|nr:Hypothetical predicted protein [Paramuricea clavata]
MKKKGMSSYRNLCHVSFETWERYSVHVSSTGHLVKEPFAAMASNIQIVPDEQVLGDLVLDDDDEVFRLENTSATELQQDWEYKGIDLDDEDLLDIDNTSETLHETFSGDKSSHFPFPSKSILIINVEEMLQPQKVLFSNKPIKGKYSYIAALGLFGSKVEKLRITVEAEKKEDTDEWSEAINAKISKAHGHVQLTKKLAENKKKAEDIEKEKIQFEVKCYATKGKQQNEQKQQNIEGEQKI